MDVKIDHSELQKKSPQVLTKFALKLGFLSKKNYLEVQQLYHLVAKDWKETIQILQALLVPAQWKLLQSVFQEWLFIEVAYKNNIINRYEGEFCLQKRIEYARHKKSSPSLVLREENLIDSQQLQEIQKLLQKTDLLPKIEDPAPTPEAKLEPEFSVSKVEFGRYEILKELGQGGMGKVYQAHDRELKRTVALKVLLNLPQHTNNSRRFFREAQLMGKLRHPNIVKIYDIGEWKEGGQNTFFFTMEWIDGHPLDDLLGKRQLTLHQSAEMLRKVAIAISYAHRQGIIHRDIKPSNIVVDQQGEPWLMDFGLAKIVKDDEKISKTGSVLGTPVYMAPEQALGKVHEIDERSDIYSLGALFYEMITGSPPFRGDSSLAIILQVVHSDPLAPRKINRAIPVDLESICLKAINKNPFGRYPSGDALADDLHRFLRGLPVQALPMNVMGIIRRKIQRNKAIVGFTTIFLTAMLCVFFYWSYNEYRLLKDLQDCMKLVLGLQQIATKNPTHRDQLVKEYLKAFDVHVKNNERNAAAYLGRSFCHLMMGDYQKTYADLTATIDLSEYSPLPISQLYLLRADCSIEYARYPEAISDLKKANVPDSELWMGKIYSDVGKYEEALFIFDRIIQAPSSGGYSWESYLLANAMKADLVSRTGQFDEALVYSKEAIKSIPFLGGSSFISVNASSVYAIHAIVLSRHQRFQEAYENFKIALEWLSSNEAVYSYLGKMYAQQGDFEQAWDFHQQVLTTPVYAHYGHYNIACYYALQKQYSQALKHLQLAMEKGYRDFTWLHLDPDLKEIHNSPQVLELLKKYSDPVF